MKNKLQFYVFLVLAGMAVVSCQKKDRPALGDYPKDTNPPGGPLKFYAAFDGTSTDPKMNAVDSIRATFASDNPLVSVEGISGKAIQADGAKAIKYPGANDFINATSFTIAFWLKRNVNPNTEFLFSLRDDSYSWSHSSLFMMIEHGTTTEATVKVGVMDQWMEFPDANKLKKPILDGNWHHWAMTYNEATSKMTYYFDGQLVENAPASATDVKNVQAAGDPKPARGKLNLSQSTNLVIGGWNRHASLDGPTDGWVGAFQGAIDQFRMYSTVLSPAEIAALYANKQ
jgi:hypothetical protein